MSVGFVDNTQAEGAHYREITPYCDVEWADKFLGEQIRYMEVWGELNAAQKLATLKQATQELDQLTYVGRKLYVAQEREWPRYLDLGSLGDIYYLQDQIPVDVAKATAIQAHYIAEAHVNGYDHRARQDHQMQGVTSINRTGASEAYDIDKARRHSLCRECWQIVKNYVARTGNLTDPYDTHSNRVV